VSFNDLKMKIEIEHKLGLIKAIEKLDGFFDQLTESEMAEGISIQNPQKNWSGNTMNISFKVQKGFLSVKIKCRVTVLENSIIIELDIPALVLKFVSEEKIRTIFSERAEKLLIEDTM